MSMNYVYSTLSNSQSVVVYLPYPGISKGTGKGSSKPSVRQRSINIHGGANVIDHAFQTPRGTVTCVSDEELKALMDNSSFKRWIDRGYITVEDTEVNPDDVARDLTARDKSAQITGEDQDARFEGGETTSDVSVETVKPRARKKAPAKIKA